MGLQSHYCTVDLIDLVVRIRQPVVFCLYSCSLCVRAQKKKEQQDLCYFMRDIMYFFRHYHLEERHILMIVLLIALLSAALVSSIYFDLKGRAYVNIWLDLLYYLVDGIKKFVLRLFELVCCFKVIPPCKF